MNTTRQSSRLNALLNSTKTTKKERTSTSLSRTRSVTASKSFPEPSIGVGSFLDYESIASSTQWAFPIATDIFTTKSVNDDEIGHIMSTEVASASHSPILVPPDKNSNGNNNDKNTNDNNIKSFFNPSTSNVIIVLIVTAVVAALMMAYVFHIVHRKRKRARISTTTSTDSHSNMSHTVERHDNHKNDKNDHDKCDSGHDKKASKFFCIIVNPLVSNLIFWNQSMIHHSYR